MKRLLTGRMSRSRFAAWFLGAFALLVSGLLGLEFLAPPHGCGPGGREQLAEALAILLYLVITLALFRAMALRLHDTGLGAAWSLAILGPPALLWFARNVHRAVGSAITGHIRDALEWGPLALAAGLVLLSLWPEQKTGNRFGPSPSPPRYERVVVLGLVVLCMVLAVMVAAPGHYTHRATVHEGLAAAGPMRTAVSEFVRDHGRLPRPDEVRLPADLSPRSLPPQVRAVRLGSSAEVIIEFSGAGRMPPACDGVTLIYRPQIEVGEVRWDCTGGTLPRPLRPYDCRPEKAR